MARRWAHQSTRHLNREPRKGQRLFVTRVKKKIRNDPASEHGVSSRTRAAPPAKIKKIKPRECDLAEPCVLLLVINKSSVQRSSVPHDLL